MLRAILRNAGIQPRRLGAALRGWRRYVKDRDEFRAEDVSAWPWGTELPMLTEWDEPAGSLGAYFFQDQLVARWILETGPVRHVDAGSRLDGFIGSLSVFREVEVIDIRPQPLAVRNVRFQQLDLMDALPAEWEESTDSLSCLHTIEHFGLGRYGDPLDANGHLKGLAQLQRMVKPGGRMYLSTPIGPQRLEFNAHRVTAAATLIGWFAAGWEIEKFAVIDDGNRVQESVDWQGTGVGENFGCALGVGIVAARKTGLSVGCGPVFR
jgi:SAM-dependent methyltransferase